MEPNIFLRNQGRPLNTYLQK